MNYKMKSFRFIAQSLPHQIHNASPLFWFKFKMWNFRNLVIGVYTRITLHVKIPPMLPALNCTISQDAVRETAPLDCSRLRQ